MSNGINLTQTWDLSLIDLKKYAVIKRATKTNVITNAGITAIAARMIGTNNNKYYTHCGVGEGSRQETAGDVSLESEVRRAAVSDASAYAGTARITTRFPHEGTNYNITEAGLFDAASAGNLLARIVSTSPFELRAATAFTATVTMQIAEA